MHSRIIAFNIDTDQDEVFEQLSGVADYVDEVERDDSWGLELLERIGTVDRDALTFKANRYEVLKMLEALYQRYQKVQINDLDDFIDPGKAWRAADALIDKFGAYVITGWDWSGYPEPWLEFLRDLYGNPELMDRTWNIAHIFDYHS